MRLKVIAPGSSSLELGFKLSYLVVESALFEAGAHLKALRMVVQRTLMLVSPTDVRVLLVGLSRA